MTKHFLITAFAVAIVGFTACKGGNKEKNTADSVKVNNIDTVAPVAVSTDDDLVVQSKDAVKDFPGVVASVANGEITLTGSIKRDRLQVLMQSVNGLRAKKVDNKLTIID